MTRPPGDRVPVRTILATIGLVLATVLLLLLLRQIQRVLVWIIIAGFFAVAVYHAKVREQVTTLLQSASCGSIFLRSAAARAIGTWVNR